MGNAQSESTLYNPNNPPPCNCSSRNKSTLVQVCLCPAKCKECALFALKYESKCTRCNKQYFNAERSKIREKYQESCGNCNINTLYFEIFYCNHQVCTICYMNNETCPICKVGKKEPETFRIEEKACPVCCESLTNFSQNSLSCSHFYCNNCLKLYIYSEIDSEYEKNEIFVKQGIKCPECDVLIPERSVDQLIDPEYMIKLMKILNKDIIECPKCSLTCEAVEETVRCQCGHHYCKTCKKIPASCDCDKNENFEITEDMSICPGCKSVYLKDEKCDHVSCANPKCKSEFCFKCSAFRSPTINHGNHYHRPSCKYFENFEGTDVMVRDCTQCRKAGKLCTRPGNLKLK